MNWATIAPETRLYKGKNLFRWEVSPGLEHHCGVCATPLHNARAKTSCIGKHVEPCYRFHQQLHFVGKSHECFGCNASDELHHNRHKEILRIVRQINALSPASSLVQPGRDLFRNPRRSSTNSTTITDTSSEPSESQGPEEAKLTRRERKKAKKSSNNSIRDKQHIEVFPKEEIDFVSEAIHLSVHESKGAWEGTYVYDYKLPEAEHEAVADVDNLDEHFENLPSQMNDLAVKPPETSKSPETMTPRQRKTQKKFNSAINHSSFNGGSRRYSSPKPDPYDGVDPEIFARLGVEIALSTTHSRKRRYLANRLVAAVKEDIEIIEREDADTKMREEGFWRWAGKTAYWAILQTRENFDWATGQKKGLARIEFPDDGEPELEESEIIDQPLDVQLESVPEQAQTQAVVEEFTTFVSKKVAVHERKQIQEKTCITKQSKAAKRALNRPPFTQDFLPIEEEGGEDFEEMIRRQKQRLAGENILGRRNQQPSLNAPPLVRGKVLLLK